MQDASVSKNTGQAVVTSAGCNTVRYHVITFDNMLSELYLGLIIHRDTSIRMGHPRLIDRARANR